MYTLLSNEYNNKLQNRYIMLYEGKLLILAIKPKCVKLSSAQKSAQTATRLSSVLIFGGVCLLEFPV